MSQNISGKSTTETRKRFLSSPKEVSQTKKHKDILQGDVEDFIFALDNLDYYVAETKPEVGVMVTMSSTNASTESNENILAILLRIESKLDKRVDDLESKIKIKDEQITELEKRVNSLELENKSYNVTIHGLPQKENENTGQIVIDTMKNHLNINLEESEMNDCYRLGKPDSEAESAGKPILVKFMRKKVRNEIFKAKSKLRDTAPSLYINEDLSKSKAKLYAEVRKLRKEKFIWKSWTFNSIIYYTLNDKDEPKVIEDMKDVNKIRVEITPRT